MGPKHDTGDLCVTVAVPVHRKQVNLIIEQVEAIEHGWIVRGEQQLPLLIGVRSQFPSLPAKREASRGFKA